VWRVDLRAEVVIDAPAAAAWAVLGERFGQIGEWAAPITSSCLDGEAMVGATRTCHFAGFGPFKAGTLTERLVEFDPGAMTLAYESVDGMPSFVKSARNRWTVQPRSAASCLVRTHATLELQGPVRLLQFVVRRRLQADGARVLDELRYQVEHGRPHPRKLAVA
jgi:Polyketide cyclase / dehydrase and lipid transport